MNKAQLSKSNLELVVALRTVMETVLRSIPEDEKPEALLRLCDWQEEKLVRKVFGGKDG